MAYHSQCSSGGLFFQSKKSTNVPVDYTQIRYVRKPHGSAAGFVTYTHQKPFMSIPAHFVMPCMPSPGAV